MAGLGKIHLRTSLQLLDLPWNMEITLFSHSALSSSFTRAHRTSLNMYTKQADLPLHPLQQKRLVGRGLCFSFCSVPGTELLFRELSEQIDVLIRFSCFWLFDPMDCSPPGSSSHGILQARILEMLCPPPGGLPNPGMEPRSPAASALSGRFFTAEPLGKREQMIDEWILFYFHFSLSLSLFFFPKSITYYINSNWMFLSLGKKGCPDKANGFSWSQPPNACFCVLSA